MAHKPNETLSVAWCDNGMTDGKFTEGLVYTLVTSQARNVRVHNAIRVQGNQIGRQRQALFDMWADQVKTDWILWLDSDIVLTTEVLEKLWEVADKNTHPVVCGIYFISKQNEGTLMQPMPCIFNDKEEHTIQYIHPLPDNEVIQIDMAGMGLALMHKSIVPKLRAVSPDYSLFAEKAEGPDDKFVSEDIVFFRNMKKAGIPVHAHTGARVKHMKRFSLDENYYKAYWSGTTGVSDGNAAGK